LSQCVKVIDKHAALIIAIGPKPEQLQHFPIEVRPWAENTEVAEIQQFDIGIMPLADTVWERGKCGYKLIQYMACGKPVVASPVGVNKLIVRHGMNGFLARTDSEWFDALDALCQDAALRKRMGNNGRKVMEQNYSLQITAPKLTDLIRSVVTN
jgi:glycosyltransferase involved in cell wall biosynthesis